jgi:murein DD-endopeptidase MepM/ murein hydrolase activator NlpD
MSSIESSSTPQERHLLIPKRHVYIGVGILVLCVLAFLVLLAMGLKVGFNQNLEPLSAEMISKLNALETKVNDTAQQVNEVFRLKEKIDQQLPKKVPANPGDGKGGIFQPIPMIDVTREDRGLSSSLLNINSSMSQISRQLPELKDQLNRSLVLLSNLPEGVPLIGTYKLTSEFGDRSDPFVTKAALHTGVDFSAPVGTPVLSTANGVVSKSVLNDSGYGNFIEITHAQGVITKYAHLDQVLVSKDEKVTKGSLIGTVGNTGRSTGSHLHFEVIVDNLPVNPMSVISPYPVKPNAASLGMYQANVSAKCANLKLILNDVNSPLMKECLARGGLQTDQLVIAKRSKDLSKAQKETGSTTNHCTTIDDENRLIVGTKSAC